MNRCCAALLLAALLAAPTALLATDESTLTTDTDPAIYSALLLADERPVVLRLRLFVDDRPLSEVWHEHAQQMFTFLDRNQDGLVDETEFRRGPWQHAEPEVTRGNVLGNLFRGFRSAPRSEDVTRGMELPRFLERFAERLPAVSVIATTGNRLPTDSFWPTLDRNDDGDLDQQELEAAVKLLDFWDINEDDQIGTVDLTQYLNPVSTMRGNESGTMRARALITLNSQLDRASAVEKLLMQYRPDAGAEQRFLPVELLTFSDAERQRVDRDADGRLDYLELAEWLNLPEPDLTIEVRREEQVEGREPNSRLSITVRDAELTGCRVLGTGHNYTVFAVAGVRLAVVLDTATLEVVSKSYEQMFDAADADNNKYVDQNESAANGIIAALFAMMDRDQDGKVYKEDLHALLDQMKQLATSRMQLNEVDDGKDLFNLLDLSADSLLSSRELRGAESLLEKWDVDANGKLANEELPRGYRITISRGALALPAYAAAPPKALGENSRERPSWFAVMDRNADGDVAANEFVGPIELFQNMDANSDGLLTLDEVATATPAPASDE